MQNSATYQWYEYKEIISTLNDGTKNIDYNLREGSYNSVINVITPLEDEYVGLYLYDNGVFGDCSKIRFMCSDEISITGLTSTKIGDYYYVDGVYNSASGSYEFEFQVESENENIVLTDIGLVKKGNVAISGETNAQLGTISIDGEYYYCKVTLTTGETATTTTITPKAISFDGNDETSGSVNTIYQLEGRDVTLPVNSFTKTGYKFLGWDTSSTAITATYSVGVTYTVGASDTTLYAIWEKIIKTQPTSTNDYTVVVGDHVTDVTYQWQKGTIEYEDATNKGLYYGSIGNNAYYPDNNTVTANTNSFFQVNDNDSNTILRFKYKGTGTITDCTKNGEYYYPTFDVEHNYFSVHIDNKGDDDQFTYIEVGIVTYSYIDGETNAQLGTISIDSEYYYCKVTLTTGETATTTTITPKAISFDGNDETSGSVNTIYQLEGRDVTLLANSFTKTGYKFLGWDTSSTAITATYSVGATYTVGASDTTLYAVWQEKTEISLDTNEQTNVYNGSSQAFELKGTHKDLDGFTIEYRGDSSWTETAPTNEGYYDVRISRDEDETYKAFSWTSGSGVFHISAKEFKYSYTNSLTKTYDGKAITSDDIFNLFTFTDADDNGAGFVGNDTFKSVFESTDEDDKALLVQVDSSYTGAFNLVDEIYVVSFDDYDTTNAGTFTVVLYIVFENYYYDNINQHTIEITDIAVTINKVTLSVTTNSATKVYDGTALTATGSCSGFITGETATFNVTGSQTNVGSSDNTYSISWGTVNENNYDISETLGTLTVKATITYNTNGATGSVPTDSNEYAYGYVTTVLGQNDLEKEGFTFAGWNTASNRSGTHYDVDAQLTIGETSVILYAEWKATYTFIYSRWGTYWYYAPTDDKIHSSAMQVLGEDINLDTICASLKKGDTIEILDYTELLVHSPKTFVNDINNHTEEGDFTYTLQNDVFYLYVGEGIAPDKGDDNFFYIFDNYLTVQYDLNGGEGTAPTDTTHYKKDDVISSLASISNITKDGYRILGWQTDNTNSLPVKTSYTIPNVQTTLASLPSNYNYITGTLTLYAVWSKEYTVAYTANAGSDTVSNMPSNTTKYINGEIFPITDQIPTRNGYKFLGWNTNSTATEKLTSYTINSSDANANSEIKLYAIWESLEYAENFEVTITDFEYGLEKDDIEIEPSDTTLTVNEFWLEYYDANSNFSSVNQIDKPGEYCLTFVLTNTNGLYFGGNKASWLDKEDAKKYYLSYQNTITISNFSEFYARSCAHFNFDAYEIYSDIDENKNVLAYNNKYLYIEAYITLTGKSVIYNKNTTDTVTNIPDTADYLNNAPVTISDKTPVRVGYKFLGWNTNKDATTAQTFTNNQFTMGTNDVTLYAIWEEKTEVTLTYNSADNIFTYNKATQSAVYTTDYDDENLTVYYSKDNGTTWSTDLPKNASTYKVKFVRTETDEEKYFEAIYELVINKAEYDTSNIKWDYDKNNPFIYDGEPHSVFVIGVPDDVTVTYVNEGGYCNSWHNVGSYTARVIFNIDTENYSNTISLSDIIWQILGQAIYNANAGDDTVTNLPEPTNCEKGYYIKLSTQIPQRTNYKFLGWTTEPTGEVVTEKIEMDWESVNFYAKWQEITLNENVQQYVYTGETQDFIVKDVTDDLTGFTVTYSPANPTNVGSYDVTITREANGNYSAISRTITNGLKITQATTEITGLTLSGWTYGKSANTPSATTNFGTIVYTYSTTENGTYTETVPTTAGTYYVKASVEGNENYTSDEEKISFTIAKADYNMSNAKWNYTTALTYNKNAQTVSVVDLPQGVTVKQYTDNSKTDVGQYTAKVTFSYDETNYNQPTLADLTWQINKATAVITVDTTPITITYGESVIVPEASTNFGDVTCDKTVNDLVNAGNYIITYTVVGTDNYNGATATINVTINQKEIVINWCNKVYVDNGNVQTITATYKDVHNQDVSLTVTLNNEFKDAGDYTATASFANGETNYKLPTIVTKQYTMLAENFELQNKESIDESKKPTDGTKVEMIGGALNANIVVVIEKDNSEQAQQIVENVKTAVNNKSEVIAKFDIHLEDENGVKVENISGNKYRITLTLPEELLNKTGYAIVYIDSNNNVTKIDSTMADEKTIVFETDHFSTWAIVADENPTTWIWFVAGAVCLVIALLLTFLLKRKITFVVNVKEIASLKLRPNQTITFIGKVNNYKWFIDEDLTKEFTKQKMGFKSITVYGKSIKETKPKTTKTSKTSSKKITKKTKGVTTAKPTKSIKTTKITKSTKTTITKPTKSVKK